MHVNNFDMYAATPFSGFSFFFKAVGFARFHTKNRGAPMNLDILIQTRSVKAGKGSWKDPT